MKKKCWVPYEGTFVKDRIHILCTHMHILGVSKNNNSKPLPVL